MKKVTIQEFVKVLEGEIVEVKSVDVYGVNVNFSKARIEYDENMNELSFVTGRHDLECGLGGVGYIVDEVIESITLEDDGSYTIQFNQYMSDVMINTRHNVKKAEL